MINSIPSFAPLSAAMEATDLCPYLLWEGALWEHFISPAKKKKNNKNSGLYQCPTGQLNTWMDEVDLDFYNTAFFMKKGEGFDYFTCVLTSHLHGSIFSELPGNLSFSLHVCRKQGDRCLGSKSQIWIPELSHKLHRIFFSPWIRKNNKTQVPCL